MNAESTAASIVLISLNRRDDLAECLASLPWDTMEALNVDVVFVDDGSTDGSGDHVARHYPQVTVLRNERPRGFAHARNQGSRAARGDLLLYIDDDAVVCPGWLEGMLAAHDGASVLGGLIVNLGDGRPQNGPAYSTFIGKRLPCKPKHATVGTGCNLGMARAVFYALSGFDEDLHYFEDSDLCIRARKAGFGFHFVPDAVVRHKGTPVKVGEKIRQQEYSSTFAMLKAYHATPVWRAAFTFLNACWLLARAAGWGLRGRFHDVYLLVSGWWRAYRAYGRWRRKG